MNGRRGVLIGIAAVYLYSFPYFSNLRHANELPRILTTEQLVERGSFALDERMNDLGSLADISTTPDGRHYQNKAPGLSIVGVLPYYPLHAGFDLAGRRPPLMLVTWLLRVLLATLPTLILVACFRSVATRFTGSAEARDGALAAFALGSMALPLGLIFMSHALAASLVGVAFAVSVAAVRARSIGEGRAALIVGAVLGLAMLCEYQSVFGAVLVAAYLLWGVERRGRTVFALALTIVPLLATLAWYHWAAFGSPFRTGYAYSVDPANRVGFMGLVGVSKTSLAQLFVHPDNGLLLLSPWVVLAAVGGVSIACQAEARARAGREALFAALIAGVYCAFVASLHPEFGRGGWSVGPRYLAIAMPFVAWLSAAGLEVCLRNRALRVTAFSLILIGVTIHVLAATTYPHWPIDFYNPVFEVSVRSLREGHAPHSLGTVAGLRGVASLAPLYVGVLALIVTLLTPTRRYLLDVSLALVVAAVAVLCYEALAVTPAHTREAMWRFVVSTLEP
jgi:hypothetical protein